MLSFDLQQARSTISPWTLRSSWARIGVAHNAVATVAASHREWRERLDMDCLLGGATMLFS